MVLWKVGLRPRRRVAGNRQRSSTERLPAARAPYLSGGDVLEVHPGIRIPSTGLVLPGTRSRISGVDSLTGEILRAEGPRDLPGKPLRVLKRRMGWGAIQNEQTRQAVRGAEARKVLGVSVEAAL